MAPAAMRRYLLQEASLLLLISYLLLFASTHNGLVNPTLLGITAGMLTLGVLALLWNSRPLPVSIERPLLVFGAVLFLSSLTSIDPRRSLAEFWLLGIACLLWMLTARLVQRGWPAELIVKALLIVGAILMAFAWLEPLRWYAQSVRATGSWLPQVSFRLSLPNFFGVILNLMLMMAVSRLLAARRSASRIFLALWILLGLGLLYLTSSRGGWLGTAAGLASLGALALPGFGKSRASLWEWLRHRRALLPVVVAFGLGGAAALLWLLYRQAMHPTHGSLLGSRAEFWGPAWNAFIQSPILGKGPYTFVSFYLSANSVPPKQLFVYAHSIYLDLLSGSGILGLAAFLWLTAAIFRKLLAEVRKGGEGRVVALGALAAWVAFLVHGLADSVHHTIPTSAWTLAILLGAATPEQTAPPRRRLSGALAVGLVVVTLSWVNYWLALPLVRGVAAANRGEWARAAAHLKEAARRDPQLAVAYQQWGLAESVLASQGEAEALDAALKAFERTAVLDPHWALNHANLGALYRQKGDLLAARQAFQRATALAPDCALYHLNLGEVEETLGNAAAAQRAYAAALRLRRDWRGAYFWRETALRQELVSTLPESAVEQPPKSLQELKAQLNSNRSRAWAYLQLAQAYLEAGRYPNAGRVLQQAGLAYFSKDEERLEWTWLMAQQAAAMGDFTRATALGQQVLDDYRQQGIYGPGSYSKLMYAPLMFRRVEMALELTPQMTVIALPDRWGERLLELGNWYAALGDAGRAQALQKELLTAIPDFYEVQRLRVQNQS